MKKISEATKAQARKSGKLPKAPKKPKKTASVDVLQKYLTKYNAYLAKIEAMAETAKRRAELVKKIF